MTDHLAYQEEIWEEMLNGKAVPMSLRPSINHNRISGNIYMIFRTYLKEKTCEAFGSGVDLYLSENDRFLPDGMIICCKDIIRKDGVHGVPDLVVEVLSPSTARYDRGYKKAAYEAAGVREYWLVEPETKSVEVYLLQNGVFVLDDVYSICPDYLFEKMTAEEKAKATTEFACSLYDDLVISLDEIFHNTF